MVRALRRGQNQRKNTSFTELNTCLFYSEFVKAETFIAQFCFGKPQKVIFFSGQSTKRGGVWGCSLRKEELFKCFFFTNLL